jgi:hypothetical protein
MTTLASGGRSTGRDYVTEDALPFRLRHGAPVFLCPSCQCTLRYEGSHGEVGGDRTADLSDSYSCPAGCASYEYVRRTHRLRIADR